MSKLLIQTEIIYKNSVLLLIWDLLISILCEFCIHMAWDLCHLLLIGMNVQAACMYKKAEICAKNLFCNFWTVFQQNMESEGRSRVHDCFLCSFKQVMHKILVYGSLQKVHGLEPINFLIMYHISLKNGR